MCAVASVLDRHMPHRQTFFHLNRATYGVYQLMCGDFFIAQWESNFCKWLALKFVAKVSLPIYGCYSFSFFYFTKEARASIAQVIILITVSGN